MHRARLALLPIEHHHGVVAGPQPDEILARTRPEADFPELWHPVELVFGDLDSVDQHHPGEIVSKVDADGVDQRGERATFGTYSFHRLRHHCMATLAGVHPLPP